MSRWDEILSLPVQNPPTLEFSAADLVWSKIEGWRDNIDRVALIHFARVDDFVKGESANKACPTRFHVEARRRRPPKAAYKPKVDGILEYILYWCSFGPDDHRKGGVVRPSRNTYIPKKKSAGRPNTKRGCTCHFIVKRLIAEPSVALIIYNQDKHVDKKGLPCHGPLDKKAAGTRAMYAPYISEDLRLRVFSLLYVGVPVESIMQRHNELVERQGGPSNRDDLLTHRFVRRQERSIRRSTHELDADDAVSLNMWVENHQSSVFFYEDFSHSGPFTVGIQTEWQLQQMIQFGNHGLLASDSRFGTNKLKYPIHSLLVFNGENKAIPVAWIICPRFASGDAYRWMRALYNRIQTKDPTWKLAGFIVDDPSADVHAIRDVFQCSVLISIWRVRHAWHKNLVKRCPEEEMCLRILKGLGQAMSEMYTGRALGFFDGFLEDNVEGPEFMEYLKAVWYPRIGCWTAALQAHPRASQEMNAAIEFYHNQLKLRLLNETEAGVYQRVDWLVDKLATKVHSYFWLDEYPGKDDFARYLKDDWMNGVTSWRTALEIPDADVILVGDSAEVIDQHDRDKVHLVLNPGSEFAICSCSFSQRGDLCEHVFKVTKVCRDRKSAKCSVSFDQFNQTLMKMLSCPPKDSLIQDHAVSLAVFVQKQLSALADIDGNNSKMTDADPASLVSPSADQDRVAADGSSGLDRIVSYAGDGVSESPEPNGTTSVLPEGLNCEVTVGNDHDRSVIGFRYDEMDVDPGTICVSPPSGQFAADGVLLADILPLNGGERPSITAETGGGLDKDVMSKDDLLTCSNGLENENYGQDSREDMMMYTVDELMNDSLVAVQNDREAKQ